MALYTKLAEVEAVGTASDAANVLVEDGGEIKRVPKAQFSGGGEATATPTAVVVDVPRVYFTGTLPQSKGEGKLPLEMRYISSTEDFTVPVQLKVQGDSSAAYPKKNYNMWVFEDVDRTTKKKLDMHGWGGMNKFCLKANWIDFTHARNVVNGRIWAKMAQTRGDYASYPQELRESPNVGTVDGFPVIVYVNGMYWGRYTWNIAKDKAMFNMDDDLETNACLVGDAANTYTLWRATPPVVSGTDWTDELHDEIPEAIRASFQGVAAFVLNSTDEEFKTNIERHFYLSSLIDLYIFTYVSLYWGGDAKSQRFDTYDGVKWLAGLYDMDTTWALKWDGSGLIDAETPFPAGYSAALELASSNLLYDRVGKLFANEIKARYAELRLGVLSNTAVVNEFEQFARVVPYCELAEDYAGTTGEGKFTGMPSVTTNTFATLRNVIVKRLAYCDKWIPLLGQAVDDGVKPLYPIESGTWEAGGWAGLILTTSNGNRVKVTNNSAAATDALFINFANPGIFTMYQKAEAINNIPTELFGLGVGNAVESSIKFVDNPSNATVAFGWRKTGESASFSEIAVTDTATDKSINVTTTAAASLSCGFAYIGTAIQPGSSIEFEVAFTVDGVAYI